MQQTYRVQEGQYQATWHGSQRADTICYHFRAAHEDKGCQTPANSAGVNEHPGSRANVSSTLNVCCKHAAQREKKEEKNVLYVRLVIAIILQLGRTVAVGNLALTVIPQ